MKNLIGAFVVVVVGAYLPVVMLALTGPDEHVARLLPVAPGWLVWFVSPHDDHSQFRAAAAATVGVISVLSWIGSKGRLLRMAVGWLAFLNSLVCVAIYVINSALLAANGVGAARLMLSPW
jgi:hypothetical protein